MRDVPLYKVEWVIDLEYYEKHPDSQLHYRVLIILIFYL